MSDALSALMELTIDQTTFRNVQPVLVGYARRALRRQDLADDLVQESWAAAAGHIGSFDHRASFRSWMVGILKHKILDHFRRAGRELPLSAAAEPTIIPTAERGLDHKAAMEVLVAALLELPELQRRAVELCDIEGMSRQQAAAALSVERGHLRVLLHRGRNRLRQALEEQGVFGSR